MTRAEVFAVLAAVATAAACTEWLGWRAERHRAGGRRIGARRGRGGDRRIVALLAALARRAGLRVTPPGDLQARIAAAGLPPRVTAADVAAVKGGAALVAALAGLPLATSAPGRLGPVVLVTVPAAGFLLPDLALRRRARRRGAVMAAELADVLDLLRVAVAAGLPLGRALAEVGARHRGLLPAELGRAAAQLALGVPRAAVLDGLVMRCPLGGIAAFRAAVDRSDRHGSPLAEPLAALAAESRTQRARRIQDRAAKAAPKIQLTVALLLVPSVMLLVAAVLVRSLL
jgi:tight adherence protein C